MAKRLTLDEMLSGVKFKPTALVRKQRPVPVANPVPQLDPILWQTYTDQKPSSLEVAGRFVPDVQKMLKDSRRFLAQRENLDLRLTVQLVEAGTETLIGTPQTRAVKADEQVELRFQLRPPLNRGVRARQNRRARRSRRVT